MALKNRRGYTLTELMIVMGVLGMMTLVTSQLLTSTFRLWRINQVRVETQRDARTIMGLIESRMREGSADSVILSRQNATEPPYSKIQFQDVDGKTHRFYALGKELRMENYSVASGSHTSTLSKDLRTLTFAYPDSTKDNLLSVALCLEKTAFSGQTREFYISVQRVSVGNP